MRIIQFQNHEKRSVVFAVRWFWITITVNWKFRICVLSVPGNYTCGSSKRWRQIGWKSYKGIKSDDRNYEKLLGIFNKRKAEDLDQSDLACVFIRFTWVYMERVVLEFDKWNSMVSNCISSREHILWPIMRCVSPEHRFIRFLMKERIIRQSWIYQSTWIGWLCSNWPFLYLYFSWYLWCASESKE